MRGHFVLARKPAAMTDLSSPEKPRSDSSQDISTLRSWTEVHSRRSPSPSKGGQPLTTVEPLPTEPVPPAAHTEALSASPLGLATRASQQDSSSHMVCIAKRFRTRSQSRQPHLPIQSACASTQVPTVSPAAGVGPPTHAVPSPKPQPRPLQPKPQGTLRPTPPFSVASIKRPRMPWDPPEAAAQGRDMLLRTRAKVPAVPHKGGLAPAFFAPVRRWCDSLLGPALPKPRPMFRPPPRSLRFCPPSTPAHRQQRVPVVSFSVQGLPANKARQDKEA